MPESIPVDLMATGGRLVPPGTTLPPRRPVPPGPVRAPTRPIRGIGDSPPPEPTLNPEPPPPLPEEPKHEHKSGVRCRYCGWDQDIDPAIPDRADVIAFRSAVFNGELYKKTVDLCDGAAEVTFRDLSGPEFTAVGVLTTAIVIKNLSITTPEGMISLHTDFRMGLAVTSLRLGTTTYTPPPIEDPNTTDLEKRHRDLRDACKSETVYRTVRDQYTLFLKTFGILVARAADRNFFSATGTAGGTPASPSAT